MSPPSDRRRLRAAWRVLAVATALLSMSSGCTWVQNNNLTTSTTPLPPFLQMATAEGQTQSAATASAATQPPGRAPSGGASLSLQVTSPQDGAVVRDPEVLVTGTAAAGAVVTVNDDIIVVGDDGQWQSRVVLEQGPNLIEIDASDDLGNERTIDLTVDYEP